MALNKFHQIYKFVMKIRNVMTEFINHEDKKPLHCKVRIRCYIMDVECLYIVNSGEITTL